MTKQPESRKDIIQSLYYAGFKFFKIFGRPHDSSITFKEVHLEPSLRVDILNISYKQQVVILELKTCREDFEHDNKWNKYLDYCDRFLFMCPVGVIKPEELPPKIGLVYVDVSNLKNPLLSVITRPGLLKPKKLTNAWFNFIFKKLAFRKLAKVNGKMIELEEEILFNTV